MAKTRLVDYLIKRLEDLGIEEIFGLPGDFNFKIVEAVEKNEKISWIGCTNELNAGYAADGYSRIKGYGAIITTFGVGELSAINAVAGSMAENVPVVKIVGIPSTKDIKNKTLLHHNLATADYQAFKRAYSNVVETTAFINTLNPINAKNEIDRVINVLIKKKKPVYIALPMDVCDLAVEDDFKIREIKSNEANLKKAVDTIIEMIKNSKNPIFVADILAKRFNSREIINDFLNKTKIPSCSFIRGIDIIESQTKNYLGIYNKSNKKAYDAISVSDCTILAGCVISDLNVPNFDFRADKNSIIDIQPFYTKIKGKKYTDVLLGDVIKKLVEEVDFGYKEAISRDFIYEKTTKADNEKLDLNYFYPKINEFLKEKDILITEVGLVPFGSMKMELKKGMDIQNQMLWGSIGWATPCALGCAMADKSRRTILITGDGSHQLTAGEISTMMRNNLKPIIFVINNSGYTIERILCDDINYKYNDIAQWNYSLLPKVFKGECFSAQVKTNKELDKVLIDIEQENKTKMCYIELFTDTLNLPKLAYGAVVHPEQLNFSR